jgi:Uma2 family endonuclease
MAGRDQVRAASPIAAVKLTYDDFVHFPDDGMRHELIDGEHYVTPSPNTRHQTISGTLYGLIWTWLEAHPVGRLFSAPFDVVFSEFDVVEPDLLYLSNERAAQMLTPLHAKGVPELVIEIGSKGTRKRDETIKRRLYERAGVSEYWIVDPMIDAIRVYRRERDRFGLPLELSREAGDVLTTPLRVRDRATARLKPGTTSVVCDFCGVRSTQLVRSVRLQPDRGNFFTSSEAGPYGPISEGPPSN